MRTGEEFWIIRRLQTEIDVLTKSLKQIATMDIKKNRGLFQKSIAESTISFVETNRKK